MSDIFVAHLESAFVLAQQNHSKITSTLSQMDGLSGVKTRHFYNNLCSINGVRNLQISSWSPSLICSALCGNNQNLMLTCIGNFKGCDMRFKMEFESQFNKFKGNVNANLIDTDYFKLDTAALGKFNIFVYDGNDHSIEAHVSALTHYYSVLDDIFIYVVENWNWASVREGTFKAFNDLKLNVVWGRDIRLTVDNTHTPIKMARDTWWNGIGAFVLQKATNHPPSQSPTPSSSNSNSMSSIPVEQSVVESSELDNLLESIVNDNDIPTEVMLEEPVAIEPAPPTTTTKNRKKKKGGK